MTQKTQVARLLNGLMYPLSSQEIAKVLNLPRPTVRRIVQEVWHVRTADGRFTR